jgi:hypothetical protein
MQTVSNTISIRVVVFQDGGKWVGQCLEYDIGAQADTIDALNDRLQVVLKAELKESLDRHGTPFGGIDPAPARFQHMWERRARSVDVSPAPWMRSNKSMSLDFALVA